MTLEDQLDIAINSPEVCAMADWYKQPDIQSRLAIIKTMQDSGDYDDGSDSDEADYIRQTYDELESDVGLVLTDRMGNFDDKGYEVAMDGVPTGECIMDDPARYIAVQS
jgi:hypothetical protein